MDDTTIRKGYRNAWILTGLSLVFILVFFLFTVKTNWPDRPVHFDMGGTPFVPAHGVHSEGYAKSYVPPTQPVGAEAK